MNIYSRNRRDTCKGEAENRWEWLIVPTKFIKIIFMS